MSSRRDFLKTTAIAGAGISLLSSDLFSKDKDTRLRLGFIGVGLRGQSHLELALRRDDVVMVALFDVQLNMLNFLLDFVSNSGRPKH